MARVWVVEARYNKATGRPVWLPYHEQGFVSNSWYDAHKAKRLAYDRCKEYAPKVWTRKDFRVREYHRLDRVPD